MAACHALCLQHHWVTTFVRQRVPKVQTQALPRVVGQLRANLPFFASSPLIGTGLQQTKCRYLRW